MDGVYTQDQKLGWIETELGKDHLLLQRFDGSDLVSGLFDYRAHVIARKGLDYDAILGTHATVFIQTVQHGAAAFDGIVTEVEWIKGSVVGDEFALTLRPWLWLAGKRRQQRIFHEQSVDEILEAVLGDWSHAGPATHRLALLETYPKLEYTVQYRETDLAFASRLMERFGISYHFEHQGGNHCMVLTDSSEEMADLPGFVRAFSPVEEFYRKDEEHFWDWRRARGMTTGKVKLTDYNFKKPSANQMVESLGDAAYNLGDIESYDYPGIYPDASAGELVAKLRTKQERSGDIRSRAAGDVASLKSGMRCAISGEFSAFTKGETYICIEARHRFTTEAYRSGSGAAEGEKDYEGQYVLTPVSAPFAPVRTTPEPIIQGPQTALVVGDGEIDCDEYGRILVRFHWDLSGANSMRCRVSQSWASKGWGGLVIPRVGMEVVVEFLEGNPDNPLVTGCVYNGQNSPSYDLPANKTKTVFKSQTHGGSGFNELSFEDEAGREEISIHAQKDLNRIILDNETTFVRDGDRTIQVKTGDEAKSIVAGNLSEQVCKTRSVQANIVAASAVASKVGPGIISYAAEDEISLRVGENALIVMTKEAIVLRFKSSQIVLTEGIIDQIADMIHLNKDKAG